MAKNLGREFATMDEEERRRFELEPKAENDERPEELELGDPRGNEQEEPPRPTER
jgi:hypothetical protein